MTAPRKRTPNHPPTHGSIVDDGSLPGRRRRRHPPFVSWTLRERGGKGGQSGSIMLYWTITTGVCLVAWLWWSHVQTILLHAAVSHTTIHGANHDHVPVSSGLQPQHTVRTATSATSNNDDEAYVFHIVFSSGCNALQDWQSYAFLYQVWKSGFTGNVTRVASCQSDEAAQTLQRHFETHIQQHMSNRFQLHITPDYSHLVSDRHAYNFFNKPHGIHHWMTEGLHFPQQASQYQRTIIVLMDPDQFLLRPFEQDMTHGRELWTSESTGYRTIQKGQPMAALYGFGGDYINHLNVTELLTVPGIREGASTSGLRNVTASLLARHYAVGPPYVVQADDMYEIVTSWSQLVVPIYQQEMRGQSPSNQNAAFLAEMHAYSLAAAHLNLPHQVSKSFMISDPESGREEAWAEWIDKTPRDEMEGKGDNDENDSNDATNICSLNYRYMPHAYHYCQRVYIGPYFFSKYQVPKSPPDDDILACSHPLYQEAPANVMDLYNSSVTLDGQWHNLSQRQRRRMAFGVCQILPRLNAAVAFYKQHHCSPASAANYSKVFIHESHDVKAKRLRFLVEQGRQPRQVDSTANK